ncbi:hypothetical protein D3C80_1710540 [compost metagenome]
MDASTLPRPKHIRGYHGEVGRSISGRNVRGCIWTACLQALDRKACPIAIKSVIDRVYPFEEAEPAFQDLRSAAHFGKECDSGLRTINRDG